VLQGGEGVGSPKCRFLEINLGKLIFCWSVCWSVCPAYLGKTTDRIRLLFNVVGQTSKGRISFTVRSRVRL